MGTLLGTAFGLIMGFWNTFSIADKITLVIAAFTAASAVAAAIAAWCARRSVREAVKQLTFQLEAFRAQTFLGVLSYEREVEFSTHMDVIRGLGGKPAANVTAAERASILVGVNFLNHIAHVIRHRYVVPKQVLLLYSPSIAACRDNLLGDGQWLPEERRKTGEPRYYLHFDKLCQEETERLTWEDRAEDVVWTPDPYEPSLPPQASH